SSRASTTCFWLIAVMQRRSIGQTRKKQGEHGTPARRIRWRELVGRPGPVISGEVLPKGTTTGVPTAAATCIGPLSLLSSTRQYFSRTQSSRRVVWPERLITIELPDDEVLFALARIPLA